MPRRQNSPTRGKIFKKANENEREAGSFRAGVGNPQAVKPGATGIATVSS
jgi:hypothetical protein